MTSPNIPSTTTGNAVRYQQVLDELRVHPKRWLVTGAAGFIGSNLVETLLQHGQYVVGLDNFSTGHRHNLDDVQAIVGSESWDRFRFIEADICDLASCQSAVTDCDYVLHQAALGSVPRSIDDPIRTNLSNVTGFLNTLVAARDEGVKSFVYAASSSTYGDHPDLPKVESVIGNPLSPYAVTKYVNELYASVFSRCYEFHSIGLRYFNVFGPRQDPHGAYAAVIPKWIQAFLDHQTVSVNGDGETSRDFCYVANAVQANILAATATGLSSSRVYNVAVGERTSLNDLFHQIRDGLQQNGYQIDQAEPIHNDFRPGDVRHSLASIQAIAEELGYYPTHTAREGLAETCSWFTQRISAINP